MQRAPGPPRAQQILILTGALLAFILIAQSRELRAQPQLSATLEGQVVDSITGKPMEGVLIRIDTGPGVLSDVNGHYRLMGLRPGRHTLALLTADCRVNWGSVDLVPGVATQASFEIAPPIGMEKQAQREEVERRRSFGKLITREEIESSNSRTLVDVIRRYAPRMVSGASWQIGAATGLRQRAPSSFSGALEPVVVIDGTRVSDGSGAIDMIRPGDVETLELLPSSSGGWEFGSSGSAGVIRITTRRGVEDIEDSNVPTCRVQDFPGLTGSISNTPKH